MTENEEPNSTRKAARRGMALEALVLFVLAWIAAMVTYFFRPPPSASFDVIHFIGATLLTGLECFVFGYVLSRFFKQFKTGCAMVIILFFAYLIWAGRHPH